jgi:2-aminoethylphosphonate-pyruvate transaminase
VRHLRGEGHVLLNPGPVSTSARVKAAAARHDVCHRDPDYGRDVARVADKLRRICGGSAEHEVLLITGSGTAAMECALASAVPSDKKILVLDNGAFGERILEIARLHEMQIVHLRWEIGQPIDLAAVERTLAELPEIAVVALVHHETSAGLLNPVDAVGALCRRHDALLLVDAVSSLGAEDLDVTRDEIDLLWSSANKCLHGAAGVSFVCASPRVWPRIETIPARVYYLDLKRYRRVMKETSQTPFTPAVGTIYALEAACDEFLADGALERIAMYARRNRRLRQGLARLGLRAFTKSGAEAHSLVTVSLPTGLTFGDLYEPLKRHGFVIYDCKPPLQGRFIQIANMGAISETTIDEFLEALARIVHGRPSMTDEVQADEGATRELAGGQ